MQQSKYKNMVRHINGETFYHGFLKSVSALGFATALWLIGYNGVYKNDFRSAVTGGIAAALSVEGYKRNSKRHRIYSSISDVINSTVVMDSDLEAKIKKTDESLKEMGLTNEEITEFRKVLKHYV